MHYLAICVAIILSILTFIPSAQADCSSPAGTSGDLLFNSASRVVQFCNGYSWMQIGDKPKGGAGCTSPGGSPGDILFNSAYRVMQSCNGQEWSAWGKLNGTGTFTGVCSSPGGTTGDLLFNSAYGFLQYCDGNTWQQTGFVPATISMNFLADNYSVNGTAYTGVANFITASGATFARASTARYFNASGTMQTAAANTPRLDYDPVTHAPKGLLIEESRTNKLLRSEDITNAAWSKASVLTSANTAVAPDGTTTADTFTANGTSNTYMAQAVSFAAGDTITRSVYAKAGTASIIQFEQKISNALTWTTFNLATGTVTGLGTGAKASMQYIGNGWYRLICTNTMANAQGAANDLAVIYIEVHGAATSGHYLYLWGAQAELGETVTSYIPTTSAAVTRAEDAMTIPTGIWFNSAAGTFIAEYNAPYLGTTNWPGAASLDDGTQSNAMHFFIANPWDKSPYAEIYAGTNSYFMQTNGVPYVAGANARIGLSYSANYTVSSADGTVGASQAGTTLPTVTLLRVGASRGDLGPLNGWVRGINYYPYVFSSSDLQRTTKP